MKYAVVNCVNGNFLIHAEGFTELSKAKVNYHGRCQALWNAPDVITATVVIVDEYLIPVKDCTEYITHTPVAPEEPTEE